jgi:hypothetical protein
LYQVARELRNEISFVSSSSSLALLPLLAAPRSPSLPPS